MSSRTRTRRYSRSKRKRYASPSRSKSHQRSYYRRHSYTSISRSRSRNRSRSRSRNKSRSRSPNSYYKMNVYSDSYRSYYEYKYSTASYHTSSTSNRRSRSRSHSRSRSSSHKKHREQRSTKTTRRFSSSESQNSHSKIVSNNNTPLTDLVTADNNITSPLIARYNDRLQSELQQASDNQAMGKQYKNTSELLDEYNILSSKHIQLLNSTQFKHIYICSHGNLWFTEKDTIFIKIKANNENEWTSFVLKYKNMIIKWISVLIGLNINKYIEIIGKDFVCLEYFDKFYKNMNWFVKAIGCNVERKCVAEWNYYGIVHWFNRVNNRMFSDIKYMSLRKHIFIGKVNGHQLCHLNNVTLNMIGIYDMNDIKLILDAISELIENDNYNNLVSNVLMNDNIPILYCDPISFELMNEPVIIESTGNVYEKEFIEEYVREYNKDPLTQKHVCIEEIKANNILKKQVDLWKENNCIKL